MKANISRLKYILVTDKNIDQIVIDIATEISKYVILRDGPSNQLVNTCPICYDTETSTYNDYTYVYIHQFVIGGLSLYTRYTDIAIRIFKAIHERDLYFDNLYGTTVFIGIANSSYDLTFIKNELHDLSDDYGSLFSVLASKSNNPIIATLESKKYETLKGRYSKKHNTKIIDICKISGLSLEKTGENYCVTQKKVGEDRLKYDLVRNSLTPLGPEELDYCMFDVIVGAEYMEYLFDKFTFEGKKFPITATSVVRNEMKRKYMEIPKGDRPNITRLFPDTVEEYDKYMTYLFRGGYTHGNAFYMGKTLENVTCADYTSDYPACMVQEAFPSEPFTPVALETTEDDIPVLESLGKIYAFILEVEFTDIRTKSFHTYESKEKIMDNKDDIRPVNPHYDNGRLFKADKIRVLLTETDFDSYKKMYTWKSLKLISAQFSPKAPLPAYVTDVVTEAYTAKANLKNAGLDKTPEYAAAKGVLNSTYGCTVQRLNLDGFEIAIDETGAVVYEGFKNADKLKKADKDYDRIREAYKETYIKDYAIQHADSLIDIEKLEEDAEKYADKRIAHKYMQKAYKEASSNKILSPFWGVWVTAYARNRLVTALTKCEEMNDNCVIYYDTDSLYVKDMDNVRSVIDEWNTEVENRNKALGLPELMWDIGQFTLDPPCYRFKHLGAKRYIKEIDTKDKKTKKVIGRHVETTVAGLKKGALEEKIKAGVEEGISEYDLNTLVIEAFCNGMIIDEMFTQKLRPVYESHPYSDIVVDYLGNECEMSQRSGVTLKGVSFKCTLANMYIAHVEFLASYVPS